MASIRNFLKFYNLRFDSLNKKLFLSIALTAVFIATSAILVPIIQRDVIGGVQEGILNSRLTFILYAVIAVQIFCAVYEALILNRLNVSIQNAMHKELFSSALRNGSKIINSRGTGAFMSSMLGDSERISGLISTNFFGLFLVFISNAVIIVIASSWSYIFIVVVAPIYLLCIALVIFSTKKEIKEYEKAREAVMEVNPQILENLENRTSVLSFADVTSVEDKMFAQFNKRDGHFRKAHRIDVFSSSAINSLKVLGLLAIFILSMFEILEGNLGFETFVAMLAYYAGVFAPIAAFQNISQNMATFKLHHDRIKDDLNKTPKKLLPKSNTLVIKDAAFSYIEGDGGKIEKLSLDINKRIGLVGVSGEGKTTVVRMLFGHIQPTDGLCLFGATNVSDISKAVLHSSLRLLSQESEVFNKSLNYNITLGKTAVNMQEYAEKLDDFKRQLSNCAKNPNIVKELFLLTDVQAKDISLIKSLHDELDTADHMHEVFASIMAARKYYVADRYDALIEKLGIEHLSDRPFGQRGNKISGGEKNKLCLARFLLPLHKGFFVADEPLAAVDSLSEEVCLNVLTEYLDFPGVVISHKLNIIKALSNEIVVLEQGAVTERGSHDELMKDGKLYSALYRKFTELHQ